MPGWYLSEAESPRNTRRHPANASCRCVCWQGGVMTRLDRADLVLLRRKQLVETLDHEKQRSKRTTLSRLPDRHVIAICHYQTFHKTCRCALKKTECCPSFPERVTYRLPAKLGNYARWAKAAENKVIKILHFRNTLSKCSAVAK